MAKKGYEQQNDTQSDQARDRAHAPYNFIPLAKGEPLAGKRVCHDRYYLDKHTGYFDVTLETVTPLFVRGMLTEQQVKDQEETQKHPYPFMLDGKPVIPGSSLRGMLRNLVEIITFGKMHFAADTLILYRSVFGDDALVELYRSFVTEINGDRHFVYPHRHLKGGYLIRDGTSESGWGIQPATEHHGESFVLVNLNAIRDNIDRNINPSSVNHKPQQVWVKPASRTHYRNRVTLEVAETSLISKTPFGGGERATLVFSKTVGRRHWYPAIFDQNTDVKPIPISHKIWQTYIDDRDMNRGISTRKLEHERDPLFYLVDDVGDLIFFGPTMFFRLPYENSVGSLIYDERPDPNRTDYADAMFGYVSERGEEKRDPVAYAGRISVTSATLIEGKTDVFYDEEHELRRTPGSPKPTTFQHYLEQPQGRQTAKRNLHHYGVRDAKIRGHKLYWRQKANMEQLKQDNTDGTKENIETKFRPVKEGKTFSFRVYFENLTDAELGALTWALTLGGDENLYHMIGMGKPYGLGVVKLSQSLVLTDREARYHKLFDANGTWHLPQKEPTDYIQAFKQALNAHGIDFDTDDRIKQLKAMLRLYNPDPELFSYMQIERMIDGEKVNEYIDRPVLPRPTEVMETYEKNASEQRKLERQKELENQIKTKSRLEVGDVIRGEVFDGGTDDIWFKPQLVEILHTWRNLAELDFQVEYEAQIPAEKVLKRRAEGLNVIGRIVEIIVGDPIELICEQIIRDKKK